MTTDDMKDLEKQVEDSVVKCCCYCRNLSPLATTGIIVGSALTTATILSPRVRKVTIPVAKYVAKQQLRMLAGIGMLSIATYLASAPDDIVEDFE